MSFAPLLSSLVQSPFVQSIIDHEREREKEKETADWLSGKTGLFAVFAANLAASLAVYGIIKRDRKDMLKAWVLLHSNNSSKLRDALNGQTAQLEAQMSSIETELGNLKSLYQDQLDPNIYTNLNGKLDNIKQAYENVVQEFHQYKSDDHDFLNQRIDALQTQLQALQSDFNTTNPMKRYLEGEEEDSSEPSFDPEDVLSTSEFDAEDHDSQN